ncbi:hypothetical protein [Micromonospora sp. NBC_01813]|uniref:hypothetical protein n=1 Tax=Micromonospora sp. NBC_01813 TaxID=2975988 RepID=UPI002DDC589B|nr:hypothetical protein [Micromonospora sp. NBC_01813]WSA06864.1 hypothetical protein OG958_21620 [Micromonospora sp. NBC_01813]
MARRSDTQWFSGDEALLELMHALTYADHPWTHPNRPDLLLALGELLAWAGDTRAYDGQHKPGWISMTHDFTEAAKALGSNVFQVVQSHIDGLANLLVPEIGSDQAGRRRLASKAQALRLTLGQTATLLAAWKDLTSACSQPTRPMKTVAARRDFFWMVVRATDRNTTELSRSLTSVLTGDPFEAQLARYYLGELEEIDLNRADHMGNPPVSLSDRLDLAAKLLSVTPTAKTHVVWLAYKNAHLNSTGMELGHIQLYWAKWLRSVLASERAKDRLPGELTSTDMPPIIPDEQDVIFARIDLGIAALPDAIRVAGEQLDALVAMSMLGVEDRWERMSGYIHAVDGQIVSQGVFRYEELPVTSRHAWQGPTARFANMAPRVAPHLPMLDPNMKDIIGALSWWRVGIDHPTAAAILLNVRVLELVASRLGVASWTTYLEKYIKNIWLHNAILEVLYYPLFEALHYRRLPPDKLTRQRELSLQADTYQSGEQGFDVQAAARHLDEIIGFIPSRLPMARELRSIKQRTANPQALNEWRRDLESTWSGWRLRLERIRNAITHGGPFTEDAVVLTHPFSQQVSVWALDMCLDGFLNGKTLQQTHDEAQKYWDQWRLRLRSATSVNEIF